MDEVSEIYIENIIDFVRLRENYETYRIGIPVRFVSEAIHAEKFYPDKHWCNSGVAKKLNPIMSKEAAKRLEPTQLEHPNPLKRMYNELLAMGPVTTRENVIEVLGRYPLVTVTKDEHGTLGASGGPERYKLRDGAWRVEVGIVRAGSWRSLAEAGIAWPA